MEILKETNYKELLMFFDDDFLRQKQRTSALKSVSYKGFDDNIMQFDVTAYSRSNKYYRNQIELVDYNQVLKDSSLKVNEAARLLLWGGNLKLHCTCPSFVYWGFQYMLTQLDTSIYPENRPPNKRNPKQRGIVCKHMRKTLQVFPFYLGTIASQLSADRRKLNI